MLIRTRVGNCLEILSFTNIKQRTFFLIQRILNELSEGCFSIAYISRTGLAVFVQSGILVLFSTKNEREDDSSNKKRISHYQYKNQSIYGLVNKDRNQILLATTSSRFEMKAGDSVLWQK